MNRTSLSKRWQRAIIINFAFAFICMLGRAESGISILLLAYVILSSFLMRYVSFNAWKDDVNE